MNRKIAIRGVLNELFHIYQMSLCISKKGFRCLNCSKRLVLLLPYYVLVLCSCSCNNLV